MSGAEMAALTIPMAAMMMGLVIVVVAMILKSRTDAQKHRERMMLAEKGAEIPRELYGDVAKLESKPNGYRAGRAWLLVLGCILVFVGLGVTVYGAARGEHAENGLVPIFIGAGFLVAERLIAKFVAKSEKS
jgi:Domain of unknown function (DUF6249)